MAAVTQIFFLLVALIYNIQADQIIQVRDPGRSFYFHPPKENNFCLISKFVGEDKFVLWNTSDPSTNNSRVPEDLKQRLQVYTNRNNETYYRIKNLIQSDSGLYQEECWTEDKVTRETNFSIVVCGKTNDEKRVDMSLGGTSEITCDGAAENLTVQWLQVDQRSWRRVFKDNTTSLVNSLQETIQKVENTSTLRLSNIRDNKYYMCLVMNQQQCVSSQYVLLIMIPETIIHSVEETAALQCPDDITDQPPDDITDQPPVWKWDDGPGLMNFDQMKNIFSTKNREVLSVHCPAGDGLCCCARCDPEDQERRAASS
ncbi:uncharacterized protein [Embiotoca jacksoni]|uniref:uncharacterized protein n=1 Tax=Embiotoca jacksoni TaxID=100190 RepID=UPI00370499E8